MYSELVYFEGAHFAHIVQYHEHVRLLRLRSVHLGRNERHRGQMVGSYGKPL